MSERFMLEVQEDPESGDCFVSFPKSFLESQDWREGDRIEWTPLDPSDESKGFTLVNKAKAEREAEGRIFVVETVISHRIRYAVRAGSAEEAGRMVLAESGGFEEFDQNCLGEQLFCAREVDEDEFVGMVDLPIERERKLRFVNPTRR